MKLLQNNDNMLRLLSFGNVAAHLAEKEFILLIKHEIWSFFVSLVLYDVQCTTKDIQNVTKGTKRCSQPFSTLTSNFSFNLVFQLRLLE